MKKGLNTNVGTKPTPKKKPAKKAPGTSTQNKSEKDLLDLSMDVENEISRFKFISDNAGDAHFLVDSDAKFKYANETACKKMGYTENELLNLGVPDVDILYDLSKYKKLFNLIQTETITPIETINKRKDGTTFPSEITVTGYHFKGQPYMFAVLRDITERKQIENTILHTQDKLEILIKERTSELQTINDNLSKEITGHKRSKEILKEKEKRFHAVATSTSDLIWEGDVRTDMLSWFGDIDSLLGYDVGKFPRTVSGHMENIHPDDHDSFIKAIENSLSTGTDFKASYRMRCKNGTYRYWKESGTAIEFEKGKAVKWVGSITDITKRMQVQKTLIKSNNKFKKLTEEFNALLNAIPDDLILLNSNMKIQWANKAFAAKFKMKASELYGKHCYKLCCNLSKTCNNCPVAKSFKSGKEEATRVMNSEGKILDKRAFPIPDRTGKVKNVIEVARDITAKIRMEEEAKLVQSKLIHTNKMTSLGTLVSGVAHEINNPNSFILHNAGTLKKIWEDVFKVLAEHHNDKGDLKLANISVSELQTLVPELLNGINEGSGRINKIVTNLRDFVRPEKGSMDEKINLNTLVMTSRSILDNHINSFTDNFHIDCCNNIPLIRGSVQKIEQVIINIIMNALQSLPDRKSGITISTSHNKRSSKVIIKVKDEGIGIPDNILEHITEPFFTTRFDSGGTGLGLSISYSIVKEHKGLMEFKSIKGIGTTVSAKFPAIKLVKRIL